MLDIVLSAVGQFRRSVKISICLVISLYFLQSGDNILRDENVKLLGHVNILIDEMIIGSSLMFVAVFDMWQALAVFIVGLKPSAFPEVLECKFSFQPNTVRAGFAQLGIPEAWVESGFNVVDPSDSGVWEAAQNQAMTAFESKIDPASTVMTEWKQATSEMGLRFKVSNGDPSVLGFQVYGFGFFKDEVPNASSGTGRLMHLIVAREGEHDNIIKFDGYFDVIRSIIKGKSILIKLYQITDARMGVKDSSVPFWLHFCIKPRFNGTLKIVAPVNLYHALDAEERIGGKLLNCTSSLI